VSHDRIHSVIQTMEAPPRP